MPPSDDALTARRRRRLSNGVFAGGGGWELVGVIGVAALGLAVTGAGRFSVDHAVTARRRLLAA